MPLNVVQYMPDDNGNLVRVPYAANRPYSKRTGGVLHRNAVTAVDKLSVPTVGAASDQADAGASLANSAMNYSVAAGNRWGPTTAPATQAITPTLNHAARFSISQSTGPGGAVAEWYDIFLSTAASPLWVGRITEAQRAAGGFIINTVGTVTTNAGTPAGSIDVGVQGTGLAYNVAPFAVNNAYTPATLPVINCAGYSRAHCLAKLTVTDLRSLPTWSMIPFFTNQLSQGDWHAGAVKTISPLSAVGLPLEADFEIDIDGSTGLALLVDAISGQGASVNIWVELA